MDQKSSFFSNKKLWILLGIVLFTLGAFAFYALRSTGITITAQSADSTGIAPDTSFLIAVRDAPEVEDLRKEIALVPDIAFDLTSDTQGTYLLTPLRPLEAASTLSITVRSKKESFTVQNKLLILSTFPAQDGAKVPINTGIEFVFNARNITLDSFRSAFSITPQVPGEYSYGDGRFVFYPVEGFGYQTAYTVKLSGDLATPDGAALGEEKTLSFTTMSVLEEKMQYMFQLSGNGISINSLSAETPLVSAYIDSALVQSGPNIGVTLHSFDSAESYKTALQKSVEQSNFKYSSTSIDTTVLREYAKFDITPVKAESDSSYDTGRWIIQFPETLPEGWYAVTFTLDVEGESASRQVFLQVSDLSIFQMTTDKEMVLWVNDTKTGQPVENAAIDIQGSMRAKAVTGADGIAAIDNLLFVEPDNNNVSTMFTITAGDRQYVDSYMYYYYNYGESPVAQQYMSYLFTDRTIYHTTDTIQVWGMVRPRLDTAVPLEDLHLVLGDSFVTQPVTLAPDGTFTATLQIENMGDYWPNLQLMSGEDQLKVACLRVEDFVKPVYTATATPEKPVYLVGNDTSAAVTLQASMYDGTPASAFTARFNTWDSSLQVVGSPDVVTDADGIGRIPLRITASPDTWYPQSYYYELSNQDAQSENFYLQGTIYAVHRDLMLNGKALLEPNTTKVEVTTHNIDLSKVQTTSQLWEDDSIRGAPTSSKVTATIHKLYYTKEKTGTHYDYIQRTKVDSFTYKRHDDIVGTRTFTTSGGSYLMEDLPRSDNDNCYYVELQTQDSLGRTVTTTIYLGVFWDRYGVYQDGLHRYNLMKQPLNTDTAKTTPGVNDYYQDIFYTFQDGEATTFTLLDNDQPIENFSGRVLYGLAQQGFSNVGISGKPQVTIPFSESLLPNYLITGAYFDGKHVFALQDTHMRFNPEKRALEVTLATDKPAYSPGDTIDVTATVKEKATGAPAANANVVLSVVDEAVFAISEQDIHILNRIYDSIFYPFVGKYTSYTPPDLGGGAEKGGGGGGEMRVKFTDTAYFSTATTDSSGTASFRCPLPDNITSWRLTSLALTDKTYAGSTKTVVSASKDYFVLPIVSEKLLAGDSLAVGVYSAGTGVGVTDPVHYKITVTGNGTQQSKETDSTIRAYAGVEFGALSQGDYTVTIEGSSGSFKDAVQLPVTVTTSGIEISLVNSFDLADGIQVEPLRYPVSISFYTPGYKTYNTVFRSALAMSSGSRADMRLARRYLALQYQKSGAQWYDPAVLEEDISDIGGRSLLPLFPYSSPDIELSVKARLAAPEMVGTSGLKGLDVANSDWYSGTKSAVYLAQALAGDPISGNLTNMLEKSDGLDYVDKIYLTMALAQTGDTKAAQLWYDKLVTPYLQVITGIAGDKALCIAGADTLRSNNDCTAAASMLASMLKTNHAEGLALYLAEKKSVYEPYLLEQMYYLTSFAPPKESASFTYVQDGKTLTQSLENGMVCLSFSRSQLAEANFQVQSGSVEADVFYACSPSQVADVSSKRIGLTKKVEAADGGAITVGSRVKITLTPDLSGLDTSVGDTYLLVDDYIPSGMRFDKFDMEYENNTPGWYLISRQGQRIRFGVYGAGSSIGVKPIIYYARCATPGEYVVESAYITSATGATWGGSNRDRVQIQ